MLGYLILLFCAVPLIELYLLFAVAARIGPVPTFLIVIATGIIGATLAKLQGWSVLHRIQSELERQQMPTVSLVDGGMILFAGALLLTPGILTDIFGFSLLIPPIRAVYRRGLMGYFKRRVKLHVVSSSYPPPAGDEIIEARVVSSNEPK